jgi:hypothetical protein
MTMPDDDPRTRLEALIGEWTVEVDLPGSVQGTASFTWVLGDRYVLQRSEVPLSDVPDGIERTKPDFSPLSFWQRFEGRFSDDGDTIEARWETSQDEGRTWELDFTLAHRRVR